MKVGPFCRKGLCSLLQAATRATLTTERHFAVERTSALAVRLAAIGRILLGKENLSGIGDRTLTNVPCVLG